MELIIIISKLNLNQLRENELDEMWKDGISEEEVQVTVNFEASWRVPNLLSARYLGEPVGAIDTEQVMLTRYA